MLEHGCGGGSLLRALDEAASDEVMEVRRPALLVLEGGGGLGGDHEDGPHRVDLCIGWSALGHLYCGDSEGPDVS